MMTFPKFKSARNGKEKDLQASCERYLELLSLRYIRIPDAVLGYLSKPSAPPQIRKLVGRYMRGQPDLVILSNGDFMLVELKSEKGKLRDSQKDWAAGMQLNVVRNFDDFKILVDCFVVNINCV